MARRLSLLEDPRFEDFYTRYQEDPVAFATEVGLDPVVEVGEGEAMVPSVRHPITLSETPADYRRPPPALDEHGDEIRAWLEEGGHE